MRLNVGVITSDKFKYVGKKEPIQKKKNRSMPDDKDTLIEVYKYPGKTKAEIEAAIESRKRKVKQH